MKLRPWLASLLLFLALTGCGGGDENTAQLAPAQAAFQSATASAQSVAAAGTTTFSGKRANYTVVKNGTVVTVSDNVGQDGVKTISNPIRLVFSDIGIAYDLSGTAGQAYRIYQAAFNRTPDLAGLGFWIAQMDKGTTLDAVSGLFISSAEFIGIYGVNPSNQSIVEKYYANVLHRPLDQSGFDFWVRNLNTGAATAAGVLAAFSESNENKAQVAGAIANGIDYTPYIPAAPLPILNVATFANCPDGNLVQSQQMFSCMIGTMSGKTVFGNATCTLNISKDGRITLASGGTTELITPPYQANVYSKYSFGNPETFFIVAFVTGLDLKVTSPKYAALNGVGNAGVQVDINELSCKFDL